MKMQHLLVEGYCDGKKKNEKNPCKNTLELGVYCFECPYFSYTDAPNEIALSNDSGLVECQEDFIGFGGDMEPEDLQRREDYISIWKNICKKKINEAYDEYIRYISLNGDKKTP